jgi:hypothetical protein
MFRITRRLQWSVNLLGLGAGALLSFAATAQDPAGPPTSPAVWFGVPQVDAPPPRIPAVQFNEPQTEAPARPAASSAAPTVPEPPQTVIEVPELPAPVASPEPTTPPVLLGFQEQIGPPVGGPIKEAAPAPAGAPASTPAATDSQCDVGSKARAGIPVSYIPRPGFFAVQPTGPGYYSLLDQLTGQYREKPPTFGYPRSAIMINAMFDTDWSYVDKEGYQPDILERLHRLHLGDNWTFGTGGEFRTRWADEHNARLSGKTNDYDLTRLRVYGDLQYKDTFRVFVEFISAQSFWQDLQPLIIDRDYADLLNAFVDLKIFQDDGAPWYVRAGRQQLLFGSQRLISPLDWANTMRTFDGVRVFRHSEKLDVDAFWARPVIPNPSQFDTSDPQQNFAGGWVEYRPTKNQMFDLYYLYLSDQDLYNAKTKTPVPVGQNPFAPYTVSTLGGRWAGNLEQNKNVLFDFEDMLQLGRSSFTNSDIVAGSSSTGLGYNFAKAPMNPTVWGYFDYASGSNNIGAGSQFSTFNQLYPFGHYYFGWLDYVARMNILDWNFHLYLYPTDWITFNTQFHVFQLASAHDALYNAGGAVLRMDPTGKAGRDVGQELDFIVNFHLTKRQDILVAYGHLFEGRFLRATGPGTSAETFWLMYNVRW